MTMDLREKVALTVIDRWMSHRINNSDLPGAQLCIRKGGKPVLNKAYGHANLKTRQQFTPKHICHIASHSKMFTSCALHMLQEAGTLSLGDLASQHIPQLKKHKDKRVQTITIRDLLSHRAGLFRDGEHSKFWEFEIPFPSREQLLKETMIANLVYEPNTVTKYSNFGMGLLGLVIETASGKPYEQFIKTEILKKLGNVHIYPDYAVDHSANFAEGHSRPIFDGIRKPLKHPSANGLASATGFCANAESISLFLHEFLLGDKLISKTAQQDLKHMNWPIFNSKNERYGLGIMTDIFDDFSLVGHRGAYQGFASESRNWLGTDYIFSFILNSNDVAMDFVKNIILLFNKVKSTFDENEIKNVVISEPMFGVWGATLYLVGTKKALQIPLDTTMSSDESLVLDKTNEGFKSDKANGYRAPGQVVIFRQTVTGAIKEVDCVGTILRKEKEFKKRIKKSLL